jgi:hypothetical protein
MYRQNFEQFALHKGHTPQKKKVWHLVQQFEEISRYSIMKGHAGCPSICMPDATA